MSAIGGLLFCEEVRVVVDMRRLKGRDEKFVGILKIK